MLHMSMWHVEGTTKKILFPLEFDLSPYYFTFSWKFRLVVWWCVSWNPNKNTPSGWFPVVPVEYVGLRKDFWWFDCILGRIHTRLDTSQPWLGTTDDVWFDVVDCGCKFRLVLPYTAAVNCKHPQIGFSFPTDTWVGRWAGVSGASAVRRWMATLMWWQVAARSTLWLRATYKDRAGRVIWRKGGYTDGGSILRQRVVFIWCAEFKRVGSKRVNVNIVALVAMPYTTLMTKARHILGFKVFARFVITDSAIIAAYSEMWPVYRFFTITTRINRYSFNPGSWIDLNITREK